MRNQKFQKNQQGIVSIVITIILMIVITLIVLSFAKISRREQRNALDRQLSTQAFYAAESGVNDVRNAVQGLTTNVDPMERAKLDRKYMTDCTEFASPAIANLPLGQALAGSGAASYTCLFVDPIPEKIVYAKSDAQRVFPLEKVGGGPIGPMEVYWDDGSGSVFTGCPAPPVNPITWPATCDAPILRVELVDADPSTPAPDDLTTSKVFFLYPSPGGGPSLSFASTNGSTALGNCNTVNPDNRCLAIINLPASKYFVRFKSIYNPAALTVAVTGATGLKGAQTLIDATGKATDVERRIQVRLPANDLSGTVPLYALEGTDKICKKFSIYGGSGVSDQGPCITAPAVIFPD